MCLPDYLSVSTCLIEDRIGAPGMRGWDFKINMLDSKSDLNW